MKAMTTVAIQYQGRALSSPGVLPRESATQCDLWWPGGEVAALLNGRLPPDELRQAVTLTSPVTFVQQGGSVVAATSPSAVCQAGQLLRVRCPAAPPAVRAGDQTHNPYLAGLTAPTGDWWHPVMGGWGPAATLTPVSQGGSAALYAHRVVPVVAALWRSHQGLSTGLSDGERRAREEGLGGYHFYDLPSGATEPRWWQAAGSPHCLFQGYGKQVGGWSTLYGATLPSNVSWPSSGLQCPEQDHAAVEVLAAYAAAAGDLVALAQARCALQSLRSSMARETSTGGRGLGHVLRGLAHTWAAAIQLGQPTEELSSMLDFVLDEVEARRQYGPGGTFTPFVDRGTSVDAYHLSPGDVGWLVDLLVQHGALTDAQRPEATRQLARSCTTFMAGIVASGALSCLHLLGPALSDMQGARLWTTLETTVAWLCRFGGAMAVVPPGALALPQGPLWDDVSPCDKAGLPPVIAHLLLGKGHAASVAPRFIQPALLGYAALLPKGQWAEPALALSRRIRESWGPWKRGGSELAGTFETGWEAASSS